MALIGVELETLVFEPDAQTTRPPPLGYIIDSKLFKNGPKKNFKQKRTFRRCCQEFFIVRCPKQRLLA